MESFSCKRILKSLSSALISSEWKVPSQVLNEFWSFSRFLLSCPLIASITLVQKAFGNAKTTQNDNSSRFVSTSYLSITPLLANVFSFDLRYSIEVLNQQKLHKSCDHHHVSALKSILLSFPVTHACIQGNWICFTRFFLFKTPL